MEQKASIWDQMANEQTDPEAYRMYKNYADDLRNQTDYLMKYGLNANSRRGMMNLKSRYNKEIVPIEQAYTTRQEQAKLQQQALLQDPTMMFSRRAATTSLDDYIRNPQLDYTPYSGKLITAQAAQAASALAKQVRDNPRQWRSILGNSYYEALMQRGFSTEDVLQAIQNNPNAAPELLRIVEDAVDSSGIRGWKDPKLLDRAYDYARQGLWSAVGETQYQNLDNWRAKMAEQEQMQIRAENRAVNRSGGRGGRETEEDNLPSLSSNSYLKATGKEGEYLQGLQGLKAGQNALQAKYFGKNGKAPVLALYEKYKDFQNAPYMVGKLGKVNSAIPIIGDKKLKEIIIQAIPGFGTNNKYKDKSGQELYNYVSMGNKNRINSKIVEEAQKVMKNDLQAHNGASEIITKAQYEALLGLGYKDGEYAKQGITHYSELLNKLNTLSQEKSYYSTNMSNYNIPGERIIGNLGYWNNSGSFSGRVYELNGDGTQGKDVSYKQMGLVDSNGKSKPITDVAYSDVTPDKIIIQVGNEGQRYLVDPNVLGNEVYNFIQDARGQLKGKTATERAQTITIGLIRLLNDYNKTASASSATGD